MATSRSIPVVDFQQLSPWPGEDVSLADSPTVQELHTAFSTVGFVLLTNHGIGRNLVSQRASAVASLQDLGGGSGTYQPCTLHCVI